MNGLKATTVITDDILNTPLQQADAATLTEVKKKISRMPMPYDCEAWAKRIMKQLYTPRTGDAVLVFHHNRLPLDFNVRDWMTLYTGKDFTPIRLDYLTLTAYVEMKEES